MTEKVASIRGGPIPFEVNHDLVEVMEMLLEEARAGILTGMVYSFHREDNKVVYGKAGCSSYTMLAGLTAAQHMLMQDLLE